MAQWRERFLAGGQAALKSRPADERDDEIQRLQAKVGEITMNNELLLERVPSARGEPAFTTAAVRLQAVLHEDILEDFGRYVIGVKIPAEFFDEQLADYSASR